MPRFSDADIAAVRDRVDIVDVVGETVALKRSGARLKGLCPFHDEKSPSFGVNPTRGYYHCFGCGAGGDVIKFVMEIQSMDFPETITYLADRFGIEITREETNEPSGPSRNTLLEVNKVAADWFAAQLTTPEAASAVEFLTTRGFTREHATTFGVGYAPADWHALHTHLQGQGFDASLIVGAGLGTEGKKGLYDSFRGRLIFPIRSTGSDIIGFGGRILPTGDDDAPKYINTPETALYRKSQVLFGVDHARKEIAARNEVVVVEGYTDVMACHIAGIPHAVAACGTAFGADHARILRRLMGQGAGRVIYLFDGDTAGQKAATRAYDLDDIFAASTYAAVLPDGMDPCEIRQTRGDRALAEAIDDPQPLFSMLLAEVTGRVHDGQPETQVEAARDAVRILSAISDQILRAQYVRKVAFETRMPVDQITQMIAQAARTPVHEPVPREEREDPDVAAAPPAPTGTMQDRAERGTLRIVLANPLVRDYWRGLTASSDYLHPTHRTLAIAIASGAPTDDDTVDPAVAALRRELLLEAETDPTDDVDALMMSLWSFADRVVRARMRVDPAPALFERLRTIATAKPVPEAH